MSLSLWRNAVTEIPVYTSYHYMALFPVLNNLGSRFDVVGWKVNWKKPTLFYKCEWSDKPKLLKITVYCKTKSNILLTKQYQSVLLKFTTQPAPYRNMYLQNYQYIQGQLRLFSPIAELSVSTSQFQTMNLVLQFALRIWEGSRPIAYCCACPSTTLPARAASLLPFSNRQNVLPFLILSASPPSNTKGLHV